MATRSQFRHEDIAAVPRGFKVRTVKQADGTEVRVAFPPGRRKKGSGKVISILKRKKNARYDRSNLGSAIQAASKTGARFVAVTALGYTVQKQRPAPFQPYYELSSSGVTKHDPHSKIPESWAGKPSRNARAGKQKTRAQVEAMQAKAVRFLRDVADKQDAADDIEDLSVEEYAAKKHVKIKNPRRGSLKPYDVHYKKPYGHGSGTIVVEASSKAQARKKGAAMLRVNEHGDFRITAIEEEKKNTNPRLGSGKRFAALERKLAARGDVSDPRAVAAAIGRRKYGKAEFQKLAARGRKAKNPRSFKRGDRVVVTKKDGLTPKGTEGTFHQYNLRGLPEASIYLDGGGAAIVSLSSLKKARRKNPDIPLREASNLFREFHGRGPHKVIEMQIDEQRRGTYTALGELWELHFKAPNRQLIKLGFEGNHVKLASSPDGKQLYLIGGDQAMPESLLKQFGADTGKDFIDLGEAVSVVYVTRKGFDGFKQSAYVHKFGEEGGFRPEGFYNRLSRNIVLAGGSYRIESPGIIN